MKSKAFGSGRMALKFGAGSVIEAFRQIGAVGY